MIISANFRLCPRRRGVRRVDGQLQGQHLQQEAPDPGPRQPV